MLVSCGDGSGGPEAIVTTAPTATVTLSPRCVLAGGTVTATIVWSEPVSGFEASDITVGGGTAGIFVPVSGSQYTLTITAGGSGTTTVDVILGDGACSDAAGDASAATVGQAAVAHAPWASGTGIDAFGVWSELTVIGNGEMSVQRFRLMAPGTFMMGSPVSEAGNLSYGTVLTEAQHQVTLTKPYWIADSECTQRMWKAVTNTNPSYHCPPAIAVENLSLPVERVSYDAVQAFLASLNLAKTSLSARLPSEAEWEYAVRAGTTTPFSISPVSSDNIYCSAWMHDAYIASGPSRDITVETKSLPPNSWGLYEVHGNVNEWCTDWYMEDMGTAAVIDPEGPAHGAYRVFRSGGFHRFAQECRSAARYGIEASQSGPALGFRLAVPAQPSGSG
jgi:sulfatase modifying factor 1